MKEKVTKQFFHRLNFNCTKNYELVSAGSVCVNTRLLYYLHKLILIVGCLVVMLILQFGKEKIVKHTASRSRKLLYHIDAPINLVALLFLLAIIFNLSLMDSPDVFLLKRFLVKWFLAKRFLAKSFLAKRVLTCWFMSMNGLLASFLS